jgi:flagellar hook-associated protein 2
MSTVIDTSFLNFNLFSPAVNKYAQIQRSSYIKSVQKQEDSVNARISELGRLLNSLEELKTSLSGIKIESLKIMKAKVSDENILSATAYSTASKGTHDVKVVRLAKSHTLYSKTYPDKNSVVGTGSLSIRVGDNIGVNIDITESRKTLLRIRDVLNASVAGITSLLTNDASGYRLVISAEDSGDENKITVIASDDDLNNTDLNGISSLAYDANTAKNLTESSPPYNAILFADNIFFEKSSNKVTDAVTGISMALLKESGEFPVNITVSEDLNTLIFEKLGAFISAYNNVINLIDELQGSRGILKENSSVGYLKNSLTDIQTKTYSNSSLKSIGFKFDTKDAASLNISTMIDAMLSDLNNVADILNSLAAELETTVNSYIDSVIPEQQKNYRTIINEYIRAEKQTLHSNK